MEATYVSIWDGDVEIKSRCQYNPETNIVTDVETVDVSGVVSLDDEYVLLPDGTEVRDFAIDGDEAESLSEEDIKTLREIAKTMNK